MENYTKTIENFKKINKVSKDIEVASLLGIHKNTFAERKKRGSIPYEAIINFCREKEISIDLIFEVDTNTNKINYKKLLIESIENITDIEAKHLYKIMDNILINK